MLIVNINRKRRYLSQGFSLIEALVAVTLLVVAILGPLNMASRGLVTSNFSNNQVTAQYLAQEGMEAVRRTRDNNAFAGRDWVVGMDACRTAKCTVDAASEIFSECVDGVCPVLKLDDDTAYYGQGLTGVNAHDSPFRREIQLAFLPYLDGNEKEYELRVTSAVYWRNTESAEEKNVTIIGSLYDWKSGE